jgi:hypothetical protein
MNFINEYPNFITQEECDFIMDNLEKRPFEPARKESSLKAYFSEFAIANLTDKEAKNKIRSLLDRVDKKLEEYFKPVEGLIPYNFRREGFSVLKTKDSGVPRHYDSEVMNNDEYDARSFLVLIYLNKLDMGGELLFPYQKVTVVPEPGKLLIFPASFAYPHLVLPYVGPERLCIRLNYVINKESIRDTNNERLNENR